MFGCNSSSTSSEINGFQNYCLIAFKILIIWNYINICKFSNRKNYIKFWKNERIEKIENFSGYMEHWYQKKLKRLHKTVSLNLKYTVGHGQRNICMENGFKTCTSRLFKSFLKDSDACRWFDSRIYHTLSAIDYGP